jgi:hypothetical protein
MFFSFLPILSAVFAICFGVGMLLIAGFLADNAYVLAGLCFLVMAVVLAQMLGPLAYRFLARAFPLKASGELHFSSLRFLQFALVAVLAVSLGLAAWGWSFVSFLLAPSGDFFERVFGAVGSYIWLTMCSILLLFSACLMWGLVKVIKFHKRPDVWASQGFLLFLRSFGSVSDSAAIGLLVRGSGVHSRVALLSSPKELMTSWDPMTLALAGFSLRHPFHCVPVYLESTERSWADDVRRLASSAKVVVIDTSHRSPGLSQEVVMLSESSLEKKTITFEELPESDFRKRDSEALRGDVVLLERSRFRRRVSQVLGFTFTYMGFLILTAVVVTVADPNWSSKVGSILLWCSLFYSVAPGIWGAWVLSPAAGFTRRSAAELVRVIQQKAADS